MRKSLLHTLGTLNCRAQRVSAVPRLSRSFGFLGNKKKTYYEILDLQSNASVKDIKKAFMKKGLPPGRGEGQIRAGGVQGDPGGVRDAVGREPEADIRPGAVEPGVYRRGHPAAQPEHQGERLQPDVLPEQVVQLQEAGRRPAFRVHGEDGGVLGGPGPGQPVLQSGTGGDGRGAVRRVPVLPQAAGGAVRGGEGQGLRLRRAGDGGHPATGGVHSGPGTGCGSVADLRVPLGIKGPDTLPHNSHFLPLAIPPIQTRHTPPLAVRPPHTFLHCPQLPLSIPRPN